MTLEFELPIYQKDFVLYRWSEKELTSEDRPIANYRLEDIQYSRILKNQRFTKQIITISDPKDWSFGKDLDIQPTPKSILYKLKCSTIISGGDVTFSPLEKIYIKSNTFCN